MNMGMVVSARCFFRGCKEKKWFSLKREEGVGEGGGNGRVGMANVDSIYAAVSKRQTPSDDRIEFNLCKHEINTGMRWVTV